MCYPYNLKPVQLTIEYREVAPGTIVVTATGRLMLGPEGERLETVVDEILATGCRRVIFDLSGITHLDSTGIGRCIAGLNRVMKAGGKMHMAGAVGHVRDCFHVTRLDRVFRFFDDVEQARAALG
jgi:anti-sigma B factor antagonist